jgi:hypothetical protein
MDEKDRAMELYKLEYEKAAERYDNVYRSIWNIFSYMTAVAAGFLAFGAERIEPHALICIASVPLIFWFWTTYLPLDRYGTDVIKRLGTIEGTLNKEFRVDLNHFKPNACKELSVFKKLRQVRKTKKGSDIWEQVHRARFAIGIFFILLHLVFVYHLIAHYRTGLPLFIDKPAASAPAAPTGNVTINR